jgi:hypothetical protein
MYVNAKVYFNEYIVEVAMEYTYLGINFLSMCVEFLLECKQTRLQVGNKAQMAMV